MSGRCGGGGGPGRLAAWPGWRPGGRPRAAFWMRRSWLAGRVLEAGPLAAGWTGPRWTLARVRDLVARRCGVRTRCRGSGTCCAGGAGPLRWARPRHRAGRRRHRGMEDPDLGPDKRTAAALGGWIVFEDESGQSLRQPRSRTWARRGITPVIRVRGGGSGHVSVAGLACYRPGDRSRLIGGCTPTGGARARPRRSPGVSTGTC